MHRSVRCSPAIIRGLEAGARRLYQRHFYSLPLERERFLFQPLCVFSPALSLLVRENAMRHNVFEDYPHDIEILNASSLLILLD